MKTDKKDLITVEPATAEDAEFVATVMAEAVGMSVMEDGSTPDEHLTNICRRTDTLYSWQNAVIAKVGDEPAGALISYDGHGYHEVKLRTFGLVPKEMLEFDIDKMDDETGDGEYYLDSLAVLPQHRGHGIASLLLKYGVGKAREKHLLPILACDPDNANALRLYMKTGFRQEGTMFIFGHEYMRMVWRDSRDDGE